MTYVDDDPARAVKALGGILHTMNLPGIPAWKRSALAWEVQAIVGLADAEGLKVTGTARTVAAKAAAGAYDLGAGR